MSTPSDKPFEPYEQPADPAAQGYAPLAGEPLSGTVLMSPSDQRLWATLAHLSPIAAALLTTVTGGFVFTGALGPLIIFLVLKDRGSFVRGQSLEALNFQIFSAIVWMVVFVVGTVLSVVTFGIGLFLFIPVLSLLGLAILVFQIIAAVKANQGIEYRYPITWRLVK